MQQYTIKLTAKEINILKEALLNRRSALQKQISEKSHLGRNIGLAIKQTRVDKIDDIHTKLSYQLSDQQPDFTPLSQRNYPQ